MFPCQCCNGIILQHKHYITTHIAQCHQTGNFERHQSRNIPRAIYHQGHRSINTLQQTCKQPIKYVKISCKDQQDMSTPSTQLVATSCIICLCVCMCVCMCVCVCVCVCTYVQMHVHMYVLCIYVCMHTLLYMLSQHITLCLHKFRIKTLPFPLRTCHTRQGNNHATA